MKRSEAVGKRAIQTGWVDREKDGRVKSRLVLKDYNRCLGRTQPEMFSPTPSTMSLKTMLAACSHDRNSDPESGHITIAIDVHTAFLHAAILESLNSHPFLTDPSCFRHDETNTLFVHVDDGLLFGPRSEVLKLVELSPTKVLMRIVGRMETLGDKTFLLG